MLPTSTHAQLEKQMLLINGATWQHSADSLAWLGADRQTPDSKSYIQHTVTAWPHRLWHALKVDQRAGPYRHGQVGALDLRHRGGQHLILVGGLCRSQVADAAANSMLLVSAADSFGHARCLHLQQQLRLGESELQSSMRHSWR